MRLVVAPAPQIPVPTITAVPNGQNEIDVTANWPGLPFAQTFLFESSSSATGPFTQVATVNPTPKGTAAVLADQTLSPSQTRFYRVRIALKYGGVTGYSIVTGATTAASSVVRNGITKFLPGHYLCDTSFGDDFDVNMTIAQGLLNGIVGTKVAGYAIGFKCSQYDTGSSSANYTQGRAWVKGVADMFGNAGKSLMLFSMDRTFGSNGAIPANTYPQRWINNGWVVAVPSGTGNSGPVQSLIANWITAAYNEYYAFWSDIMTVADPHPAVALVYPWGESSMAATVPTFGNSSSSANYGTWLQNYVNFVTQLTIDFPHTPVRFQLNDTGGYSDTTAAGSWTLLNRIANTPNIICGGPDSETEGPTQAQVTHLINGWNSYRGQPGNFTPGQPGSVDCFPRLGFCAESQAGATLTSSSTPANMLTWSQSYVHEQYRIWGTYSGFSAFSKSNLIAFINTNPGINTTPPSLGSWATGGSTSTLTAPSLLTLNLVGQTVPFANSGTAPVPPAPNLLSCYFTQGTASAGISGNVVYRSSTGPNTGFSPIINTSSFAIGGLAAKTGSVSSSGSVMVFTDTNATNCVGTVVGSETQPPTVYYPATTYWYRVSVVDTQGNESAKSATQRIVWYQNGQIAPSMAAYIASLKTAGTWSATQSYNFCNYGDDFNGGGGANCNATYNSTSGNPQGGNVCLQLVFINQADGIYIPVFSGISATWNCWAGAYSGEQFDLNPSIALNNGDLTYQAVIAGDIDLTPPGGPVASGNVINLPAMSANTWQTITTSFSILLRDFGASPYTTSVQQNANYKRLLQNHRADFTLFVDNWLFNGFP